MRILATLLAVALATSVYASPEVGKPAPEFTLKDLSASGGVKIVEIGRFENRCIRGRISVKRRCASPWLQR
jgi:hypothetical protein